MINVSITGRDNLFNEGVRLLITNIIERDLNDTVTFFTDATPDVISGIDVFICSFSIGEINQCRPGLIHRKERSLIIGFNKEADRVNDEVLPLCFKNILLLRYNERLQEIRTQIICAWKKISRMSTIKSFPDCSLCMRNNFTERQFRVVERICNGEDILLIAKSLGIHYKTVSNHKRQVMNKYNLKSNQDLFVFVRKLNEQSI